MPFYSFTGEGGGEGRKPIPTRLEALQTQKHVGLVHHSVSSTLHRAWHITQAPQIWIADWLTYGATCVVGNGPNTSFVTSIDYLEKKNASSTFQRRTLRLKMLSEAARCKPRLSVMSMLVLLVQAGAQYKPPGRFLAASNFVKFL